MTDAPSLCESVEEWLRANARKLGWVEERLLHDMGHGKLTAGYEVSSVLVSISAWDSGLCLDVDALIRATGDISIVSAGPCNDASAAIGRLEEIGPWVAANAPV